MINTQHADGSMPWKRLQFYSSNWVQMLQLCCAWLLKLLHRAQHCYLLSHQGLVTSDLLWNMKRNNTTVSSLKSGNLEKKDFVALPHHESLESSGASGIHQMLHLKPKNNILFPLFPFFFFFLTDKCLYPSSKSYILFWILHWIHWIFSHFSWF